MRRFYVSDPRLRLPIWHFSNYINYPMFSFHVLREHLDNFTSTSLFLSAFVTDSIETSFFFEL